MGPLLYGIVFGLPLLGLGLFCALYALLIQTENVLEDAADQTPEEIESARQHTLVPAKDRRSVS